MSKHQIEFLVGDNAFHGISHLSQQRSRDRSIKINPSNVQNATQLVKASLENGATGFMFSVSETTLAILERLDEDKKPDLYAIVPYAYEYVRLATKFGGVPGLAKKVSKEIILSRNLFRVAPNLIGILRADLIAFLKTYLIYEMSRIKSAAGKSANLKSVILHEVITDMALALDLDKFFNSYIQFFKKSKTRPGFETRNFPYLVEKFHQWHIDISKVTLVASFNKVGFQMNPSKDACEASLQELSDAHVIAISALAAGYLKPNEAFDYLVNLRNLSQIVVGVSRMEQATSTFKVLADKFNISTLKNEKITSA